MKKNPLFVVTNKGQDVQMVSNLLEGFFAKIGLRSFYDLLFKTLQEYLQLIGQILRGHPLLEMLENFFKKIEQSFNQFFAT